MISLEQILSELPVERRKRIEMRAQELYHVEMSLRTLRKAREMTQASLAEQLGINQENVSRIEKRTDLLLSTLTKYVEGMGGKLRIVAEFPDSPPITLKGIEDLDDGLTEEERASFAKVTQEDSKTRAA